MSQLTETKDVVQNQYRQANAMFVHLLPHYDTQPGLSNSECQRVQVGVEHTNPRCTAA